MTNGQKWFLVILGGISIAFFFVIFTITSFISGNTTYKTPEQEKAENYSKCAVRAAQYFSGDNEAQALRDCGSIYGER